MMFPFVAYEQVDLGAANRHLEDWGHKMGPVNRPIGMAMAHALSHEGRFVAITITSDLIRECVAGRQDLTRANTIELSRVCASRPDLCRVVLRLWREFVFPALGAAHAISYQDAAMHTGGLYRFDGWERIGYSHSGTDKRSGRKGRNKYIWLWPRHSQPREKV